MTLVGAWVRNRGDLRELVVASDSRLAAGDRWDCCPKIMILPRTDAVLAFVGRAWLAYPTMLQVANAIEVSPAQRERRYDVADLATLVNDILNQMLDLRAVDRHLRDDARSDMSETDFVLAGWSWRYAKFMAWRLYFDGHGSQPIYRRATALKTTPDLDGARVTWIGDLAQTARKELVRRRRADGKTGADSLDMEPFSVLCDLISSGQHDTIGGAPQVVKIYRHMNVQPFGVMWPPAAKERFESISGRPLLVWEKPYYSFIDPNRRANTRCTGTPLATRRTPSCRPVGRRLRASTNPPQTSQRTSSKRSAVRVATYATSKGAIEQLTRVAAAELGSLGITVNAVGPGATDTDLLRYANPESVLAQVPALTPLGRLGQPADVADVVSMLASPDGRWLTGRSSTPLVAWA